MDDETIKKNSKKQELLTQENSHLWPIIILKKAVFIQKTAFSMRQAHKKTAVCHSKNRFLRFFGLFFSIKTATVIDLLA